MICKLAAIEDIEDNRWYEFSLQSETGLVSVMLIRKAGEYKAYINACPHQGRRMDYSSGQFLLTETGNIICPAHGAEFKADTGLCVNGPCLGQSLVSAFVQTDEKNIYTVIE
ncbi:MAG TPA: Rieske (2Fe-2S) protein [Oceanospirillales bacterium]|nr:Rieske (2Fe-2S) protein [Oceanospirillales bacterium]